MLTIFLFLIWPLNNLMAQLPICQFPNGERVNSIAFIAPNMFAAGQFPVGRTFLVRGASIRFVADQTFHINGGISGLMYGTYAINGQHIILTDSGGLYGCKGKDGKQVTGTYNWQFRDDTLMLTLVQDECETRRVAFQNGLFLPDVNEKAVIQAEREFFQTHLRGERQQVAALVTDDFDVIEDNRSGYSKQTLLQRLRPGVTEFTIEFANLSARVTGHTAIATGHRFFMRKGEKRPLDGALFTDVFIWQNGRWQITASHATSLPAWQYWELADNELRKLTAIDCSQQASLKSLNSVTPTYIRFTNNTSEPVAITWINYEGKPEKTPSQSHTLAPKETAFRYTFVTHPFIITDTKGNCISIYQPAAEPSLALIATK